MNEPTWSLPPEPAPDTQDATPPPPGTAGDAVSGRPAIIGYEVLGELGRGGMGVVYKARQTNLNRIVALKMILAGEHAGAETLGRFRREAEAVARLQHPNVVQIHEIGEQAGLPFFSLEFVPGGSLTARLAGTPQPARWSAGLVETLARAVHYAHGQGVVHRDLKPANVLLAADGGPKITDFGLAKRLDGGDRTRTGTILGTPSYMAPEQADGKVREVGPAADVYALGAILYECLTGRPPFLGETPLDVVAQVLGQDPVPVRQLQPKVPRDLETVCLKCLGKEPGRRYPSAAALADDLGRFLSGEPIRARPAGAAERLVKWARRRPGLAASAGVAAVAVSALVAVGVVYHVQLEWHNEQLRLANARETAARQRAERNLLRARQAVQDMLADAGFKDLADVPGMELVRRGLLEKALGYYRDFLAEDGTDPGTRLETGTAAYEAGDVYALLGQGDQADAAYGKALAVLQGLADEFPNEPRYRRELAVALNKLGKRQDARGRFTDAEATYRRGLGLLQGLSAVDPADASLRLERARVLGNLAVVLSLADRADDAEKAYQDALDLVGPLVAAEPGRLDYLERQADQFNNLGILRKEHHEPAQAERALQRAGELYARLVAQAPQAAGYRSRLANGHSILGNLFWGEDRLPEALEEYRLALAERRRLVEDFRHVPAYRLALADSCDAVGQLQCLTWNARAGAAAVAGAAGGLAVETTVAKGQLLCGEALNLKEALTGGFPNVPEYRSSLGRSLQEQGTLFRKAGYLADARQFQDKAVTLHRQAVDLEPENIRYRRSLATAYDELARTLLLLGDYPAAAAAAAGLAGVFPGNPDNALQAACLLGRGAQFAGADDRLPPDERARVAAGLGDGAVDLLRVVLDAKFKTPRELSDHPDLNALRRHDGFRKLVGPAPG
jgi:serine/threonine-protein kinase